MLRTKQRLLVVAESELVDPGSPFLRRWGAG
jgi:hypothetical protein